MRELVDTRKFIDGASENLYLRLLTSQELSSVIWDMILTVKNNFSEYNMLGKEASEKFTRVLGCCIHEDEKLLIYEYLANKSLDCLPFRLPDRFPEGCHNLLMDPMLATGGTVTATVDLMKDRGAEITQIRIIFAVAAPPILKKLHRKFPGYALIHLWFIVPGLGDAGDPEHNSFRYLLA
ncbi:hypothetical protein GUJ93_ZPchr0008g14082 [Zizania palustris]|uniref:uracil phosphoribosyltransferase n=1 Tax=Zizania palustris TaxID=103762 RepID=A0A8J5RJ79_ZIZPA|nr:hypothetical protein GUJ93_ZPchr0008g14082 [Zizania palustris]